MQKNLKLKKFLWSIHYKNCLNLLNKSKNVIFFSESVTRNYVFEAWSIDTPTFIYNKNKYLKLKTYAEPCPYFKNK